MSSNSCLIPSPEERRFLEIQEVAERAMLEKVSEAVSEAATEMKRELQKAKIPFETTNEEYFLFAVQQSAFVRLCGGDPDTLQGGKREIGERILRNGQNIIDQYWSGNGDPNS